MNLSYRRMAPDDIPQCRALPLLDGFAYDAPTLARIPDLWRRLLAGGGAVAWVVEDRDRPPGAEIVAMEMAAFVTDEFAAACAHLPPYLGRNVVDRWLAGRSPLLDLPAVRAANSGRGLNMICLHTVTVVPPQSDEFRPIHDKNFEAYRLLCAGYNYRQMLVEVYGREQMGWNLNAGFRLRSDYGAIPPHLRPARHPAGREPYLIGATREEAAASFGSVLAILFQYAPPRFFFNPREQDLLEAALGGLSDEEAAAALCVAHPTVRKRWESIYARVSQAAPHLLGSADAPAARTGPQKKRLLLSYLRAHPEELRPVLPPRESAAASRRGV